MSDYWSCTKFADWVRGTVKPPSGTSEEWNTWEKNAKKKKFRYWLAEDGLDYLQDFTFWPKNRLMSLIYYINNCWITKTHALTSNLERGRWHDYDFRLLHAAFDELVNFVEVEEAWMHVVCSDEARKKYKTPWYRTIFRIRSWRCPEAGLAYLEWASNLKNDEDWMDKNHPDYGKPTHQALAAQETYALYTWWKETRPKRSDPMEASGLSAFYDEQEAKAKARGEDSLWALSSNKSEEESECWKKLSDIYHKMEEEQEEEDTEMLIRLVKVRKSLWT